MQLSLSFSSSKAFCMNKNKRLSVWYSGILSQMCVGLSALKSSAISIPTACLYIRGEVVLQVQNKYDNVMLKVWFGFGPKRFQGTCWNNRCYRSSWSLIAVLNSRSKGLSLQATDSLIIKSLHNQLIQNQTFQEFILQYYWIIQCCKIFWLKGLEESAHIF